MRTSFSSRRLLRFLLAILFAVCATTYSVLWIIHNQHSKPQSGFTNYQYSAAAGSMTVGEVILGSAADRAGLRPGHRIYAIDGQRLDTLRPFYEEIVVGQNDVLELTVEDPSSPGKQRQLELPVHGGRRVPPRTMELNDLLGLAVDYYPLGFLVVGVVVLLLRTDDANAWLLALLFGGFLAVAPLFEGNIPPPFRGFAVFYKLVMSWSGLALFYYFFAVFPSQSPVDRKVPWLKYVLLAAALITTIPIGIRCLFAGGTLPLYLGFHWPGAEFFKSVLALQNGSPTPAPRGWLSLGVTFYFWAFIGAIALGLASLISNRFLSTDAQVRRKAQVMVLGTVIGTAPIMCLVSAAALLGFVRIPMAVWQVAVLLLSTLWPLSFAYAVVKHRVLEIPLLLRRSARYVLVQRGYIVFLLAAGAIAITLFTHTISRFLVQGSNVGMTVSALFGIALVWLSTPAVKRGTQRIDRAFFRSAYDARVILQDLAEKARTVTDRDELAWLLESKIEGALHPKSLACYLEGNDGLLITLSGSRHPGPETSSAALPRPYFPRRFGAVFIPEQMDTIPTSLPLLHELAVRGKAWDVPQGPDTSIGSTPLTPECLVPILGRDSRLIGLLLLGPRL
jgi:sigma-B regulation protein RsbU (phosphoserine phosphatase)